MKIAIVGTGNAGCAHAYKMSELGFTVNLIKTSHSVNEDNFTEIVRNGGIYGLDSTTLDKDVKFQKLGLITRDLHKGLEDVDVIFLMTQSLQHDVVADLLIPAIDSKTKLLIVIPGNLGSLFFYNRIKQNTDIIIAEGESTPFDARIIKPGVVNILFKNIRNAVGFLPNHKSTLGLAILQRIIPTYHAIRTNIVESALHNPNLIVHTVGVIMSASRIEYMKGEFWMYKESFSPAIWNIVKRLDAEKNLVIEAYGGIGMSYLDACKYRNEFDLTKDSLEVFNNYANSGGPKGPDSLNSRYLFEDVQLGLCTLKYLADLANIHTPVADSLITLASCLVDYDFKGKQRTMESFGLLKSYNSLKQYVNS